MDTLGTSRAERRQPWPLCAVVAVVVVAGCLLFSHYWNLHLLPDLARHLTWASLDVVALVALATPYLVLGIVLAVWGLDARHRFAGFVVALLAGLTLWGVQEVLSHWHSAQSSQSTLRAFDWFITLTIPTLLALAWGLARRRGGGWLVGVLVAPVLAWVHHELFLHSMSWNSWESGIRQWWERDLLLVVPAVAAALVCWYIEDATRRRAHPAPPTPAELEHAS